MNAELNGLLRLLGVTRLDGPAAWRRVAMVLNHGCVPARPGAVPWGFKLLILGERGHPEWFARCSWTHRSEMLRETELLETLTSDALGRVHVPELRTGYTERLFVQLTRHLGSRAYGAQLTRIRAERWTSDVGEIIAVAEALMERATVLMPALRTQRTVDERQAVLARDMTRLAAAGVSAATLDVVTGALERVRDLPFRLQHGDLWPSNVIRNDGRWWIIDFAECGFVWVPLYDAFHMLHHASPSAVQDWYAVDARTVPDRWTRSRWSLVADLAARHRFTAAEVGTCLVHYLVHLAAYRLRPGVPLMWSADLLRTIERVATWLASGRTVAELLPIGETVAQAP